MLFSGESGSLCAKCKGRLWCGKERCPIVVKFYAQNKAKPLIDSTHLEGSSPPSVFVGRYNYPKVFVGPMVPPQHGDTNFMDTPEMWTGKSIEEIVDFRFRLVRGKFLTGVKNFEGKIIERTREIALSEQSPSAEVEFKSKPVGRIALSDDVQPFGPSAPVIDLNIENQPFNKRIERAFYDADLKAVDAVNRLYKDGVLISKIQKAFSVGAFGIGKNRMFVPTRWSITAVDDMISKNMIEYTKTYPLINEYRIYEYNYLDNRWIILMLPREWSYELIEAWYPKTLWNPDKANIEIFADHEFYDGRKKYPDIGGCYFASRLAVNELLNNERRQAGVVVMREAHPGYIMPVGVWNVRESVRKALETSPIRFSSLDQMLDYIAKKLDIPMKKWIETSAVLRDTMRQKRLIDFIKVKPYVSKGSTL
ncbi:MAG: Nre family DNA repair protein [Candidatus Aenigmatarchaeota archaeon]